jgi:hypothetical protein
VPLRKPSDYFNDKVSKNSLDLVKEELSFAEPEKIERVSEAFNIFKSNLNHIESLSDFTSTFDTFKSNFEKIENLSNNIEQIRESIQDLIRKEDLDNAMMAHLFFVEESIRNIQTNVKSLNSKTLIDIKEEFNDLSNLVDKFVTVEIPSYKKVVLDSEQRVDERFLTYKESLESRISNFDYEITDRLENIFDKVKGINNADLQDIRENVFSIDEKVNSILEEDLPNYKKFFADTEIKVEQRILDSENISNGKIEDLREDYKTRIDSLKEDFSNLLEYELPKYKNILTETKIKTEVEIENIEKDVENKILSIKEVVDEIERKFDSKNLLIDEVLSSKTSEIEELVKSSKEEFDSVSKTYENLYKDFKNREIYENKKLESYSDKLSDFENKLNVLEESITNEVCELQGNLDISTSKYYDVLKKEVGYFEENISDKIKNLEVNIVVNEKHINNIKESVHKVLDDLKLDLIEEKSRELTDKISHVEKILKEFNEKTLLNEEQTFTIAGTPDEKTTDPLTPLDKNYVTIKDLQDHYRIFINRIQQQLATIGGGGAGFMKDLADVSFDESTGENKLLIFNGTDWVGIASTSISGSSALVDLTDVDTSNLGDGRFLRYNASTSEFTFSPVSASNLELIAGDIQSGVLTTSSTGPAIVMSISASTYRSANYQIQVTEGTNYNMTTINVIHDGSNTYMTEYGTINQPIGIATFSTDISGGSLRLIGYPSFASDTTFKVVFTAIEA